MGGMIAAAACIGCLAGITAGVVIGIWLVGRKPPAWDLGQWLLSGRVIPDD